MKKRLLTLAMAAGLLPLTASAAEVKFINQSSWDIYEIYFSPTNQDEWGEDYLGEDVLEHGDSLTLTDVAPGHWDVRLIDEDDDPCILKNVSITVDDTWAINDEDLLTCQINS
ncbi:hypothetical protein ACLPHM_01425 [Paenalcaligenes sp. Me131]|uniref:hypothetical protein n=1 Tax=Paenalcaligenes sp. Me131 TaxID=3392636 RepID=UPI003D290F30